LQKHKKYDLISVILVYLFINMSFLYSRNEMLSKLREIVKQSNFISDYIISYAEGLHDDEKLAKFLVLVYESFVLEKSLNDNLKKIIANNIIEINMKKVEIYKQTEKQVIQDAELIDKELFEENLLNF
jgi:hypothetical protein